MAIERRDRFSDNISGQPGGNAVKPGILHLQEHRTG
jgi:hypothetical protein